MTTLKTTQDRFPNKTAKVELDDNLNGREYRNVKKELRSCQHLLVDSELERARHKVFISAKEIHNATKVDKELDHFYDNLMCAAKHESSF